METKRRENILRLANHLGCKKEGAKDAFDYDAPEYRVLEPECVTDEMAEVLMTFKRREKVTAPMIATRCGKSEEETHRILFEAAVVGIVIVEKVNGVDEFWYEPWVPGIMEMMNNNKENIAKYPQIAKAFDDYGRIRGAASTGMFPVGIGLMRVIPIETALDGNSKTVSYEQVSKYLEDNDRFSVSDCSCRTSREAIGEGCGHLKEDMCIQLGHAAEYYIRTGRGREITREEAYEIIRRAEENGLMHQVPNIDGEGKTHAICNCCGCGCYSLRSASMFLNADMVRSNYVAKVDREKCVACGECVVNCPVNALKLGQKLCGSKGVVTQIKRDETPRNTEWTPDRYNPDYRINRQNTVESGTAPCITKCPAHISVQGYIKLASQGRYKEALELIKTDNPFPAVCGRICPHGCESECTRGQLDEPIAIDEIKKFIAQQDLDAKHRYIPRIRHNYSDKKIAIIGGGPAGLSCAYYLALDGYDITVYEKETTLGGMLTLGIPSFRLEKDVIHSEIEVLKELGVKFEVGVEIGKDLTFDDLRSKGVKGFYLAIGASKGRKLGIEGEDSENVCSGIDFLKEVNLGAKTTVGANTIIIGGGNVAIDVARTASRVGGTNVQMFCLETRDQMPALDEEIEEALEENITINNSYGPHKFIVENGKVVQVQFKKCIRVINDQGKFAPEYDESDLITVDCDHILLSVGQSIDFGNMLDGESVELNPNNTVKADAKTFQTNQLDIFVGGDVYTGPQYAIHAIAAGKEGAISLHRYVQHGQSLVYGRDNQNYLSLDKTTLELGGFDNAKRQRTPQEKHDTTNFKDTRTTFTEEQMKLESQRCLGCGATLVDEFLCVGCGQCTTQCKFGAITLERVYDKPNVIFEDMKKEVVKNVIKRKIRITSKNFKKAFFTKG